MKIKLFVLFAMLAAVVVFSSCAATQNIIINVNMTCEEFQYKSSELGNEFEINIGDEIRAKMCINATSGYSWDYKIDNQDVMEFVSHDTIQPDPNGDLADAPGVDIWLYKAVGPGDAVINMAYTKPTANGTDTKYTYTLDITVLDNQNQ